MSWVATSSIYHLPERKEETPRYNKTMEDVLDILHERGFVQQVSEEERLHDLAGRQPITLYWGYDATAASLHVGSLVSLMMLSWFQRCSHRPIALAGGGTTLVGDP